MNCDGIICYIDRYFIPVTSPLLQDLLKSIDITTPHILAIGLHKTTASPNTVIFFNNFGCQLPCFEQAYTTRACKVPSLLWYSISTGMVVFSDNLSCALLGFINVHIATLPEGPFSSIRY
jgi:hypothetical protein